MPLQSSGRNEIAGFRRIVPPRGSGLSDWVREPQPYVGSFLCRWHSITTTSRYPRRDKAALTAHVTVCSNCGMACGRILAVDFGTKNVGLACCDELGVAVRPLPSVLNRGRRALVERLRSAVQEHRIERLVVGIPFNMDGSSGKAVQRVERFMEVLRAELDLPLCGFDERLTTTEAGEIWRGMGSRQRTKYRTVDSLAAALILERYLEES